jgi:hypothetical protein
MIVGPHNNFSVAVKMNKNYIRTKTTGVGSAADFAMKASADGTDNRFVQSNTPFKEIIVSTGTNDSGFNLDPAANSNEVYQQQYAPFQHAGFISEWTIDLNQKDADNDFSQVNWDTLSDVVITGVVSIETDYGDYAKGAAHYLDEIFKQINRDQPFSLLHHIRNDFGNELHKFKVDPSASQLAFPIDKSRFPYIAQHHKITLKEIEIVTKANQLENNAIGTSLLKFERKQSMGDYTIFIAKKLVDGTDLSLETTQAPLVFKLQVDKESAAETFISWKYILEKNS